MAEKILLSADSTCDLDEQLKERYQVEFFPLHIILEEKDYLDNVTISPDTIYQAYRDRKVLPKTAAVNVEEYIRHFKPWVEEGYEIIHVNIGSGLSSSYQNCLLAAKELGHVYPVNSCSLSTGTGLLVIQAAKLIETGHCAKEISRMVQDMTSRVHASFVVDTLEFLHAGGRCSSVALLGANLLNIKPSIEVDNKDGSMDMGKLYRGRQNKCLVNYVKEKLAAYPDIDYERIFITHSGIELSYITKVRETIDQLADFKEIFVTRASCTISSHCGPGTLGILFMTKS